MLIHLLTHSLTHSVFVESSGIRMKRETERKESQTLPPLFPTMHGWYSPRFDFSSIMDSPCLTQALPLSVSSTTHLFCIEFILYSNDCWFPVSKSCAILLMRSDIAEVESFNGNMSLRIPVAY